MSVTLPPEPPGVASKRVLAATGAVLLLVALCAGAVWGLYPSVRQPVTVSVGIFPEPRLETRPVADYTAWLALQRARLAGAEGWTPIEAAMAQVAARGPDAYAPVEPLP